MKRMNNINTVTYNYEGDFYVDIVYSEGSIDCWLYKRHVGIKDCMFSIFKPIPDNEQYIIELILNDIEDEIQYYIREYCYEDT